MMDVYHSLETFEGERGRRGSIVFSTRALLSALFQNVRSLLKVLGGASNWPRGKTAIYHTSLTEFHLIALRAEQLIYLLWFLYSMFVFASAFSESEATLLSKQ